MPALKRGALQNHIRSATGKGASFYFHINLPVTGLLPAQPLKHDPGIFEHGILRIADNRNMLIRKLQETMPSGLTASIINQNIFYL